jgi:cell division protein FtsN
MGILYQILRIFRIFLTRQRVFILSKLIWQMMAKSRKNQLTYRPLKGGRYDRRGSTIWLWLLTGMFVGILGAAIIYMMLMGSSTANKFKQVAHTHAAAPTAIVPPSKSTSHPEPVKQQPEIVKQPQKKATSQQFEFYNILPKIEAPNTAPKTASKPATHPAANTASTNAKATASPQLLPKIELNAKKDLNSKTKLAAAQYLVQVGLFRKSNQADELKANLALQGFSPTIQKITAQDGAWFRVTVGPYSSESLAQKQKSRLEKYRIHAVLVLQ